MQPVFSPPQRALYLLIDIQEGTFAAFVSNMGPRWCWKYSWPELARLLKKLLGQKMFCPMITPGSSISSAVCEVLFLMLDYLALNLLCFMEMHHVSTKLRAQD